MSIFILKLNKKDERGYIVLLTVLIVGAVAASIASSLLFLGADASRQVNVKDKSFQSMAISDACAEEALEKIRESGTFTGIGSISFTNGSCSYNVTNTGGTNRQIIASSTVDTVIRKVKITLDKVKPLNVTSWQEVVDL